MTAAMQAVVGEALGDPSQYQLTTVPRPEPGPGELLIEIEVAGLGYVDALIAAGRYQVKPTPPYCPGLEFSGRVAALGPDVSGFAVGDPVAASAFGGGLAEYAVVPAPSATILPSTFDLTAAAGFIVNYTTAWHALLDRGALRAGETLLVLGAAGGTGLAAIQVGRLAGARVIAAASTAEKRSFAQAHGAHDTLDYTQPEWRKTLKAMTGGKGVDVVFDPVGGDLLEPAFRSLAWRGRYLVIGFTGGPIPSLPVNLALLKGSSLVGVDYRQFGSVHEPDGAEAAQRELFAAADRGDLKPVSGTCFPLTEFREAMQLAASRDGCGKTCVRIR